MEIRHHAAAAQSEAGLRQKLSIGWRATLRRNAARSTRLTHYRQVCWEDRMAQDYKPGEIVPQSGVYRITHDPAHADMPHEVTVIKGRRFPTCRHCKGVRFELAHAAKHVGEIDHLEEAHAPAG